MEERKDVSKSDKDFIKNYDVDGNKVYILEVDVEYPKIFLMFMVIFHFQLKERKFKNAMSLFVI